MTNTKAVVALDIGATKLASAIGECCEELHRYPTMATKHATHGRGADRRASEVFGRSVEVIELVALAENDSRAKALLKWVRVGGATPRANEAKAGSRR